MSNNTSQRIYALNNIAYNRILKKLKRGSKGEWSYNGICPHKNPKECVCEKNLNILKNGKIMRLVNGIWHPVLSESEALSLYFKTNYNISLSRYFNK
jgi:hypothetical protein